MEATALRYKTYEEDSSLQEVEALITAHLGPGWYLSVEHSAEITPRQARWECWGRAFSAAKEWRAAVDAIAQCRAFHPDRIIRLHARRFYPETSLTVWVHRAE